MMSARRGEMSETVCDVRKIKKKIKKSKTELLLCWDLGLERVYCFNCGGTVSVSIPRY